MVIRVLGLAGSSFIRRKNVEDLGLVALTVASGLRDSDSRITSTMIVPTL